MVFKHYHSQPSFLISHLTSLLQINTNEIFCIILASTVMTLFFDSPFGNLKKLIFDTKRESQQQKPEAPQKEQNVDVNANEITDHRKSE
jgi:hypothetical protein